MVTINSIAYRYFINSYNRISIVSTNLFTFVFYSSVTKIVQFTDFVGY